MDVQRPFREAEKKEASPKLWLVLDWRERFRNKLALTHPSNPLQPSLSPDSSN